MSRRRHRSGHWGKLMFWGLLMVLVALFLFRKPFEGLFNKTEVVPIQPNVSTQWQLLAGIKELTKTQTGTYTVFVYDLKTDYGFGINEQTIVIAASVAKIPILAALYTLANDKQVDLDALITVQPQDLQTGTGVAQAGQVYSVKTLARLMMEKSDNTAAHLLSVHIGVDRIQQLIDQWGLTQTSFADNKTSLVDISRLLVRMYRGEVANSALTSEMLGFMDDSDFEDRLPALLPKEIKIYHKIGTELNSLHDVGIVDMPDRPYIVGVLTHGIADESKTAQTIAQISKMVFDYQKSLP